MQPNRPRISAMNGHIGGVVGRSQCKGWFAGFMA